MANCGRNKPLSEKELQREIDKIHQGDLDNMETNESDESGSEIEDFIDFEESESEYLPSDDSVDEPGPSKKRKNKFYDTTERKKNIKRRVTTIDVTDIPDHMQREEDSLSEKEDNQLEDKDVPEEDAIANQQYVNNNTQPSIPKVSLKGKNGHRWTTVAPKVIGRTPRRNIIHIMPGPKDLAKIALTIHDAFSLFITDSVIDTIVKHTNVEISVRSTMYKDSKATISETCSSEIKALIGLLYFSAAMKNNHLPTSELFDEKLCGVNYKAVMSEARLKFLINCLRFDDKSTRDERKKK